VSGNEATCGAESAATLRPMLEGGLKLLMHEAVAGNEATQGAASAATLRPASSDSGSENKNENKDETKDRKERKPATNWALKASEKVRDNAAMREKLHPRNASQRQLLPSKKVLATTVVTLGKSARQSSSLARSLARSLSLCVFLSRSRARSQSLSLSLSLSRHFLCLCLVCVCFCSCVRVSAAGKWRKRLSSS
jgi:hypothetical protein